MNNKRNISITAPVTFTEVLYQYSCPFEWVTSITTKENQIRRRFSNTLYNYTLTTCISNGELPYKIVFKIFKSE